MEYNAAIKRNEILPFAMMWMGLEGIMLSEISKSEKDNFHSSDLSDMRNLSGRVGGLRVGNEKMKQDGIGRETNHKRLLISQNKQGCWGWGEGEGGW